MSASAKRFPPHRSQTARRRVGSRHEMLVRYVALREAVWVGEGRSWNADQAGWVTQHAKAVVTDWRRLDGALVHLQARGGEPAVKEAPFPAAAMTPADLSPQRLARTKSLSLVIEIPASVLVGRDAVSHVLRAMGIWAEWAETSTSGFLSGAPGIVPDG